MRIPSGVTDQYVYFVAVDSTDFTTRETGLSSFTVYRSRDGGTATAYTTPTVTEVDATNMPGVYKLLLDEDTTIASGNQSEEMALHITATGMAPVTRVIELYRPSVTAGETLTVASGLGAADVTNWKGATAPAMTGDAFARLGAPAGASVSADIAVIDANVDAILVDTAEIGAAGAGLTALASATDLAAVLTDTGTTLPAQIAALNDPSAATVAAAVWDEVLTGATHNIATSAGRRLRGIQDNQSYDGGSIWIDTVNGTAGTTIYENGTSGLPVSTLADALTLAVAANLKHLHLVNSSTVTLASTLDSYELSGDEWGLNFGGQSVNNTSIHNAHRAGTGVTGTFSGNPHILHSTIGAAGITGPNARIGWCAILGPITSNSTGTWVIHSSWGLSGATFDFGAGGATTVYITDWLGGPLQIDNMATGDVLYLEGKASGAVTLSASCTGGTVWIAGDIPLTNSGSGQTINQTSRYELSLVADAVWDEAIAGHAGVGSTGEALTTVGTAVGNIETATTAIKVKTDELTFTVGGLADVNIQYVNDVAVVGDGSSGNEWGPA